MKNNPLLPIGSMESLYGFPVFKSTAIPHEQPRVEMRQIDQPWCTSEFRDAVNQRLLESFGTGSYAYIFNGNMVMNPYHLEIMRSVVTS